MNPSKSELLQKYTGYRWLIDRGIVGFEPFTALQPWFFEPEERQFFVSEHWPDGPSEAPLLVFARRQDCDDLACLKAGSGNALEVVAIQGWTSGGYEIIETYPTFWEWVKSVIDDVAAWSELPDR